MSIDYSDEVGWPAEPTRVYATKRCTHRQAMFQTERDKKARATGQGGEVICYVS